MLVEKIRSSEREPRTFQRDTAASLVSRMWRHESPARFNPDAFYIVGSYAVGSTYVIDSAHIRDLAHTFFVRCFEVDEVDVRTFKPGPFHWGNLSRRFPLYAHEHCPLVFVALSARGAESSGQRDLMSRLEDAAEKGDARAFINTVREIKWGSVSAQDAARAINLALRAGTPTAAQHIYNEGMKSHPNSPELHKFARLFAPKRQAVKTLPPNPTLNANREWLKSHRAEYRGSWIALRNGELLATATSLDELIRRVGDTANVLLTKA